MRADNDSPQPESSMQGARDQHIMDVAKNMEHTDSAQESSAQADLAQADLEQANPAQADPVNADTQANSNSNLSETTGTHGTAAIVEETLAASPGKKPKKSKDEKGFGIRDFLLWCGIPVLIVMLLRIFVFGMYVIPSKSMEDTIMPGDRVITTKLVPHPFELQRGDIIVFKDPAHWLAEEHTSFASDYLIKRLIGLPGDTVQCDGNGAPVMVNGVAINESSYIRPGTEPSNFPFKVTVTEGHVFVMGDNRANSSDSRYHQHDGDNGLVPIKDVIGIAFARYWPWGRIGLLNEHHEVFADVPAPKSGE